MASLTDNLARRLNRAIPVLDPAFRPETRGLSLANCDDCTKNAAVNAATQMLRVIDMIETLKASQPIRARVLLRPVAAPVAAPSVSPALPGWFPGLDDLIGRNPTDIEAVGVFLVEIMLATFYDITPVTALEVAGTKIKPRISRRTRVRDCEFRTMWGQTTPSRGQKVRSQARFNETPGDRTRKP